MQILIVEREDHFKAADLRARFPHLTIHDARSVNEALPHAAECEVLIALAHEVTDELLAAMPKLRYIAALSTGVDHLWTCKNLRPDIRITNGRGIHGPQMAEMAFLFMIGLSRDYLRMEANQRNHVWKRWAQPVLVGKTAVIVGIGAISEAVAARCKAFEMRVVGVSNARQESPGFDLIVPRARLSKAAEATLDRVYARSPFPTDEVVAGVRELHRELPKKVVLDYFAERRRGDGGGRGGGGGSRGKGSSDSAAAGGGGSSPSARGASSRARAPARD